MKLPFETPVELRSNLNVDEVYAHLASAIPGRFSFFKSKIEYPVAGVVKRDGCFLRARTWYNNSFQRLLYLKFIEENYGTSLVGVFRPHRGTLIFGAVWFGFLALFSVVWVWASLRGEVLTVEGSHPKGIPAQWYEIFFPFLMMFIGVMLVRYGLWLSRRSEPKVLEFVERTLTSTSQGDRKSGSRTTPSNAEFFIKPRRVMPEP